MSFAYSVDTEDLAVCTEGAEADVEAEGQACVGPSPNNTVDAEDEGARRPTELRTLEMLRPTGATNESNMRLLRVLRVEAVELEEAADPRKLEVLDAALGLEGVAKSVMEEPVALINPAPASRSEPIGGLGCVNCSPRSEDISSSKRQRVKVPCNLAFRAIQTAAASGEDPGGARKSQGPSTTSSFPSCTSKRPIASLDASRFFLLVAMATSSTTAVTFLEGNFSRSTSSNCGLQRCSRACDESLNF
mmetsp:Transcript_79440/g.230647  ORF Transcript_79440/g.230647 Transcript_79440/m.230647 type:complete len:247 (+) Transcript_79440:186-926(+)